MPCPPPVSVQRRMLRTVAADNACTGDVWEYAVAFTWMRQWKKSLEITDGNESNGPSSFDMVPSLDKDVGSNQKQSVGPVFMADCDADNFFVPESQWKLYITWFGLDSKHTLQRRPVIGGYRPLQCDRTVLSGEYILTDKNLDFLPVWVSTLKDLDSNKKEHILSVFAWESLEYIVIQARRVLGIGANRRTRLWFIMQEDAEDIVMEPVWREGQSLISKVVEAVPEVVNILRKRQYQVPPESLCEDRPVTRGNLSEVWFGKRILNIIVAVEETGMNVSKQKDGDWYHSLKSLEEEFDSIMTISSIRNHWDDVLASQLDHHFQDIEDKTAGIKDELMSSAREIVAEKLDEINQLRTDLERKLDQALAKEQQLNSKESELVEREKELKGKLEKFKTGLTDFLVQKKRLEEELKTIEAQNKITDSKVTLNVGGHHYTTSVVTLIKEESLLAIMFSGRHPLKQESDGSYFIDRDGTNFRYVLNFLRDGPKSVESIPDNPKLVQEILVEAEYYQLKSLVESLKELTGQDSSEQGFHSV